MGDKDYQRLTQVRARSGFAVAFTSRTRLWLGSDHLLLVETHGYTETYKRFYFQDIQTFVQQETKRGLAWNIVLGAVLALAVILAIVTMPGSSPANWQGGELAGGIVLATIIVVFATLLSVNLFAGPTCKTYLRTAVQIEELPSLSRIRQSGRVLDRIRPLIVAAQGQLTGDEVAARMREIVRGQGSVQQAGPFPAASVPPVIS